MFKMFPHISELEISLLSKADMGILKSQHRGGSIEVILVAMDSNPPQECLIKPFEKDHQSDAKDWIHYIYGQNFQETFLLNGGF